MKCPKCGSDKVHEHKLLWSGTGKGEMFENFLPSTYLYHSCLECGKKIVKNPSKSPK